jgi:hypothetical protein
MRHMSVTPFSLVEVFIILEDYKSTNVKAMNDIPSGKKVAY